jgi:hypothetical protein
VAQADAEIRPADGVPDGAPSGEADARAADALPLFAAEAGGAEHDPARAARPDRLESRREPPMGQFQEASAEFGG